MRLTSAASGNEDRLRILVTGGQGQIGWELRDALEPLGDVRTTTRAELDLSSDTSIRDAIRDLRPHLIVNAAAYTSVDKAESEPELARRINSDAVAVLAVEAKFVGAAMIHYSTDYVFDGLKATPYVEDDAPNPLSVYGRTKLAGERAVAEAGIPFLVLRTSWVYGGRGTNFLMTILKRATERPELRVVADQTGAPTWSRDIARATATIAERWMVRAGREWNAADLSGVYHLTATGGTSWYGFAAEAIRLRKLSLQETGEGQTGWARLEAISTAQYPTAAARPRNSRLNCNKLAFAFDYHLPHWQDSLREVLQSTFQEGM